MDYHDYYTSDECTTVWFLQDGYNYQQEDGIGAAMAAYLGVSAFGMFANFFTLVIMYNATNVMRPRNYLIISHMFIDCFQCSVTMPVSSGVWNIVTWTLNLNFC
jgi:hypothetical protein